MFSLQDDFLSPGEACVKPIVPSKTTDVKAAEISLNDCLACSGCVTSAESVLIMAQSTEEFETRTQETLAGGGVIVVSIAAEARDMGFQVEDAVVELGGVCPDCRAEGEARARGGAEGEDRS